MAMDAAAKTACVTAIVSALGIPPGPAYAPAVAAWTIIIDQIVSLITTNAVVVPAAGGLLAGAFSYINGAGATAPVLGKGDVT